MCDEHTNCYPDSYCNVYADSNSHININAYLDWFGDPNCYSYKHSANGNACRADIDCTGILYFQRYLYRNANFSVYFHAYVYEYLNSDLYFCFNADVRADVHKHICTHIHPYVYSDSNRDEYTGFHTNEPANKYGYKPTK